jgi:hypothetical protein
MDLGVTYHSKHAYAEPVFVLLYGNMIPLGKSLSCTRKLFSSPHGVRNMSFWAPLSISISNRAYHELILASCILDQILISERLYVCPREKETKWQEYE